jgi:murein DD-endopeptidase MepM/ murein hydrolase activator NlpD
MLRTYARSLVSLLVTLSGVAACGDNPWESWVDPLCSTYPDWQTSPYVLPYEVGTSHEVVQGNCTSPNVNEFNSHQESGPWACAYDFLMPVGTPVVAARGGTVIYLWEGFANDQGNNSVIVEHEDGTIAGYGHLDRNGVLVVIGQTIAQGDRIALSGTSGTDTPHLHFQVTPCSTGPDTGACKTLPVTFRNTTPNPTGLLRGESYEAFAY